MSSEWVPYHERERLSIPHLLAITANQLTAGMVWTPIGLLLNPMCQKFGLNNVITTLIILIGPVAGLIAPSMASVYSDRCMLKWGRRRIFMVVGEALAFVGLMLMAFCDKMGSAGVFGLVAGQTIVSFGGNIFGSPGRTLCSDLAPDSQQVLVGNLCQVQGAIGNILSNLMGTLKLADKVGMQNAQFTLLISCIVGFVALAISIAASHEEPLTEPPPEGKNPFALIFDSFKLLDLPMWLVCTSNLFYQLGNNQWGTQLGTFLGINIFGGIAKSDKASEKYLVDLYDDGVEHSQTLSLIQQCVQLAVSFASTAITGLIGNMGFWILGLACGLIAQLFFWIQPSNEWVYVVPAMLWAFDQVAGAVPFNVISIYGDRNNLGGMLAVVTFMGNVAGFLANFLFTMGIGSIPWFKENVGRIIGISMIFTFGGLIIGVIGIKMLEKTHAPEMLDNGVDNDEKEDVDDDRML